MSLPAILRPRLLPIALAILLSAAAPARTTRVTHSRTEPVLLLSDLHFDPFADPALVPQLAQAPVSQWSAILRRSRPAGLGHYGADTDAALLRATLAAARQRAPHPAFILISGDFLSHGFDKAYRKADPNGGEAGYRSFVNKTIAFVSNQIAAAFPGVPIYPALGNNDSACGDYHIQPGGAFLRSTARAWRRLVAPSGYPSAFARQFARAGYYSLPLPLPHTRLLALNNIYWSRSYANACGSPHTRAGHEEMAWLARQLARARARHEKVWLLGHIPPGIDVYSTLHHHRQPICSKSVVPMYAPAYAGAYLALLRRYASTIALAVEGHTHMDDFRIVDAALPVPMQIVPAASPIFGNNPGFIVWTVDRRTGAIRNSTAWALANFPAAGAVPHWSVEANFDRAYHASGWSGATLVRLEQHLVSDPTLRATYEHAFTGGGVGGIKASTAHAYWCSLSHLGVAAYAACYCSQAATAKAAGTR